MAQLKISKYDNISKILEFAGLSTKEVQTYQIANQEEMQTIQQEKS